MSHKYIQRVFIIIALILLSMRDSEAQSELNQRRNQVKLHEDAFVEDALDITEQSSLDDYINVVLKQNAGLKSSFFKWKSLLSKVAQEFSLPDPQVTYTDYIDSVETRVGPQNSSFSISQKFPSFDKLWVRKSKAFHEAESAFFSFQLKRLELAYQITEVYYEYAYLGKAILLTEENMKLLSNFESVAQARYASGIQKNQDLLKVQVELGRLENRLYSLQDVRKTLVSRLNALMNLSQSNSLPWPNESLEDIVVNDKALDMEHLEKVFQENNPKLRSLEMNIEANKDNVKLSKRAYVPDVTLGFKQINTGEALNSSVVDSGKDAQMLMFSVNVPIWFNRLKAGVEGAEASLEVAKNLKESRENELLSKLTLVHYKLKDALRQSKLYQNALIPKATQTLNATQAGYESGDVDFLSLIDAQRVLLDFQLAYYRHNADFYQRL